MDSQRVASPGPQNGPRLLELLLRAYNAEADNLVRDLKPYKLDAAQERLAKLPRRSLDSARRWTSIFPALTTSFGSTSSP